MSISTVTIVGAGYMGGGIAQVLAIAGFQVAVADVDFIEEAVFERVDVKREVLGRISEHARLDAIIGTNTSTIPVK